MLAVYLDARLLAIFGQGFSSGLPMPLTTTTLAYWLARDGVDLTSIGLFSMLGLPYSLKFLWAPVLDRFPLPLLGRLGLRRGWMIGLQAGLVAAIAGLGFVDPAATPLATAIVVFVVALCSASQDVAVDAYRIEILAPHEQGAGAAMTQAGYRAGMLASGAGALALADYADWRTVYAVLAGLLALAMLAVVFAREPRHEAAGAGDAAGERAARAAERVPTAPSRPPSGALGRALIAPLQGLVRWDRWPLVLVFALLYKVGDAVAGAMTSPFFVALGFSGVEIATVTKVVGLAASVVGILAGGVLVARTSIRPALVLGGILQAVTNLLYVWLAAAGHDVRVLSIAIVADQFTGGVASAAFVAYFSTLCRGAWSGSQYALLTSLMAAGRTLIAGGSGWLAAKLGWGAFFAGTAAFALPGLLLLAALPDPSRAPDREAR
ncbi:MAG: MFS transporter [Myxococcota bacterium]